MIVTCDHCGARYKLDDARISGRGAKITCPRCRHIFVVYKERPADAVDTTQTESDPESAAPAPEEPAAPAPDLDVHGLDFRKVGIASWKVKVKIGLVYDFSDFKTLSKYIQDGRVTSTDLLSHNGSDWTPIGEIPDLEQHFVQVYVDAERALAAEADAAAQEDVGDFDDDDAPTNIMGMDNLADSLGAERASQAAGTATPKQLGGGTEAESIEHLFKSATPDDDAPPRFVDPFEQRKKARQAKSRPKSSGGEARSTKKSAPPRKAPPKEESSSSLPLLLLAAVAVVAVLGGGYWWSQQQGGTTTTEVAPTPPPQPPPQPTPPPAEEPADNGSILGDDVGEPVQEDEVEEDWLGEDDEPELIPVVPEEFRNGNTPRAAGAPPSTPASQGGLTQSGGGDVQYSAMSAADHYQAGRAAMGRARYAEAAQAYGQAHQMDPNNAVYEGGLGAAMLRSGDASGARPHLERASQRGHAPSLVYLGDIAADEGDVAGAIGYYQQYLATNPRDAGRVQQKIDQLNGA